MRTSNLRHYVLEWNTGVDMTSLDRCWTLSSNFITQQPYLIHHSCILETQMWFWGSHSSKDVVGLLVVTPCWLVIRYKSSPQDATIQSNNIDTESQVFTSFLRQTQNYINRKKWELMQDVARKVAEIIKKKHRNETKRNTGKNKWKT